MSIYMSYEYAKISESKATIRNYWTMMCLMLMGHYYLRQFTENE